MIHNSKQFHTAFQPVIEKAIDGVMKKLLDEYKNIIIRVVYDVYVPKRYQTTYGFVDSWITETNGFALGLIANAQGTLKQDPLSMETRPSDYVHGNPLKGDLRTEMADMIFGGTGYMFNKDKSAAYLKKRDAWKVLLKQVGVKKISDWFREEMAKQGFKLTQTRNRG